MPIFFNPLCSIFWCQVPVLLLYLTTSFTTFRGIIFYLFCFFTSVILIFACSTESVLPALKLTFFLSENNLLWPLQHSWSNSFTVNSLLTLMTFPEPPHSHYTVSRDYALGKFSSCLHQIRCFYLFSRI